MVKPGIAVLAERGFAELRGLRIGLVTNPTGVLPGGTTTIDALFRAPGIKLSALFGPEHGVRGDTAAGESVSTRTDARTGLPAYSLYGATKSPTAAMLRGIDALVFDIQDIGCRSYTYLSTLGAVLEGAARHHVPVIVCDRPNLLGGAHVEGTPTHPGFVSFVSRYPVAYRHGMTLGEAARFLVGRGIVPKLELHVIPCANLTRTMAGWESFGGLPWIPTSPNIPTPDAAVLYAVTGIVGELPAVSIGIGTDAPFGYFGAPGVSAERLAAALNAYPLSGFTFQPATWTPRKGTFAGTSCGGVRIRVSDIARAELCRPNFALLCALRTAAPQIKPFAQIELFDVSCGTDAVRRAFLKGASEADVWAVFQEGVGAFDKARVPYLLYPAG